MEVQARLHQVEPAALQEAAARDGETLREERRPTRWEMEKLQEERLEDQRKHAARASWRASRRTWSTRRTWRRSRGLARGVAGGGCRPNGGGDLRRERAKNEPKFSTLWPSLTAARRRASASASGRSASRGGQLRARRARAGRRRRSLRAAWTVGVEALDLARGATCPAAPPSAAPGAYLAGANARDLAGRKRRFAALLANGPAPEHGGARGRSSGGRRSLPAADDLIAAVAEARARTHFSPRLPKRAPYLGLGKSPRRGGTDSSVIEEMSAKSTQTCARPRWSARPRN